MTSKRKPIPTRRASFIQPEQLPAHVMEKLNQAVDGVSSTHIEPIYLAGILRGLRISADLVCDLCGHRAYPGDRERHEIHGPNNAGNYTHKWGDHEELCKATSIWSQIRWEERKLE